MEQRSRKEHILELVSVLRPGESKKLELYGRERKFLKDQGYIVSPIPEETLGKVRALCIVKCPEEEG